MQRPRFSGKARKRLSSVIASREAVVGVVLAMAVELANRWLFTGEGQSTSAGSALAVTIAAIGLLLAVHRQLVQDHLATELERIDRMADVVDIAIESDSSPISGLLTAYLRVTEPEFRDVKTQLVNNTIEQLRQLEREKRSSTLGTLEYYQWLFHAFDSLRNGEYMHAVSLSSDTEWNDSELERKFLTKNREAAKAKAEIARIFVVEPARLSGFLKLTPVDAHCVEADEGLRGYYVDRDQLERTDAALLKSIGEGFIDFNGRVGLEDIFDPDGAVRGQVTLNPADLKRMASIYDRLQNMAVPLSRSLSST